jgi:hypothetical protein
VGGGVCAVVAVVVVVAVVSAAKALADNTQPIATDKIVFFMMSLSTQKWYERIKTRKPQK